MKILCLIVCFVALQLSAQTNISVNNIKATGNVAANGTVTGSNIPATISGTGACVSQFVRILNSGLPPTCATVGSGDLASSLALITPSIDVASGISLNLSGSEIIGTTLGVSGTSSFAAISATQVTNTGDELLSSGKVVKWNADTGLSRDSAGVVDVGNGAQGNASGTLNAANVTGLTGQISPNVAGGIDVGTTALPFSGIRIGAAATNNVRVTATATAGRTATLPDNTGTIAELNLAQTWSAAQGFNGGMTTSAGSLMTNYNGNSTAGAGILSIVGYDRQVSKTTAQGATTLLTTGAGTTLYMVMSGTACTTTSSGATVQINLIYTDTSNTVQTVSGASSICTTLGANSAASLQFSFMAKNGTAINYSTTIGSTPTYDMRIAIIQVGIN